MHFHPSAWSHDASRKTTRTRHQAFSLSLYGQANHIPISSPASLQTPMDPAPSQECPSTSRTLGTTPSVDKTEIDGVSCLRNSFTNYNISGHVSDILMASWRSGSQKQYKTFIEQWLTFCGEREINSHSPQNRWSFRFLLLLLLITGQRGQSIHLPNTITIHLSDTSSVSNLTSHTNTSKPGKPASAITIQVLKQECRICPIKNTEGIHKTYRLYQRRWTTVV